MIKIHNLTREFKRGSELVMALNGVNAQIEDGEFVCLMGSSGSGKTTLLNILGALDRPTKGEVMIDDENIGEINEQEQALFRRQRVGFIFQFFYLQSYHTALENIALPLVFQCVPYEERIKKAQELLEVVGLAERANHRPDELSGGERQRVAIARALIHQPKILLADEPTGNLDKKNSEEIMKLLKRLNEEQGTTIVLVTHDEHVGSYGQRIIKMQKGEILS